MCMLCIHVDYKSIVDYALWFVMSNGFIASLTTSLKSHSFEGDNTPTLLHKLEAKHSRSEG